MIKRILVDTNFLFSTILFPGSTPAKALEQVIERHELILCEQNLAELCEIVSRKVPYLIGDTEKFLRKLSYEEIAVGKDAAPQIRDDTDQPIVNAALAQNIDIILTGDKDFLSMNLDFPKCMTAAQFLEAERK